MIVLADERFASQANKNEISHWLRDKITVKETYSELQKDMKAFFSNIEEMNLVPQRQVQMIDRPKALMNAEDAPTKKLNVGASSNPLPVAIV